MSKRHRTGITRPAPWARKEAHHRERQLVHVALLAGDPEDVLDPPAHHSLHQEHIAQEAPQEVQRRVFRHWKAPFWKRRTARRHERNRAIAMLGAAEPESPGTAITV